MLLKRGNDLLNVYIVTYIFIKVKKMLYNPGWKQYSVRAACGSEPCLDIANSTTLCQKVQTGCGVHPACYSVGAGVKRLGRGVDH
jgi:hypothetical protein